MTAGAWKASAGALARLPVAQAVNLTRALEESKKAGFFVVGLDAEGTTDMRDMPIADGLGPGERVRGQAETYTGTFTTAAKQYQKTLDEAQWRGLALGATYRLSPGLLGGVPEVTPI